LFTEPLAKVVNIPAVPVLLRTAIATQEQEAQTAPAVQPRSAQPLQAFAQWSAQARAQASGAGSGMLPSSTHSR
jgi:hypothetical protein